MGTQFFLFYDILLVAILLGIVYRGVRQGFSARISGLIGAVLAFTIALALSAPAAAFVYDSWISPSVVSKVNYTESVTGASAGSAGAAFDTLRRTDMSKALISGDTIAKIESEIVPDSAGNATLNLMDVDLRQTGIAEGDLSFFGLEAKLFLSKVHIGRIDISAADYNSYELEDIILARIISHKTAERAKTNHEELYKIMDDTMPEFSKATQGGADMVAKLIISIINNDSADLETAVNNNLVRPAMLIPLRGLMFTIIFALVTLLVSAIAKSLNIISYIPIAGRVNSLLGGVLGLVQSALVIFLVCIAVRIIVTLTGDNILFLNTMTIDETFIFRHVYNLKFLSF
jgi:hypothetical protein